MLSDHRFAERIIENHTAFCAYRMTGAPLVLFRQRPAASSKKSVYNLLLRFHMTWQNVVSWQNIATWQNVVQTGQRLISGREAQKELTVFRNIATIFVNRGSRPDLAKKAERELVRTLSTEFYERARGRTQKENTAVKKREATEEIVGAKRIVSTLEEQMRVQKTVIAELQKKVSAAPSAPELNMNRLTEEVMKRMEREMRLERLRRGL